MQTQILSILNQHCAKKDPLILALSGGPDSVYLLDILAKNKYKLIIAHMNHLLRGEDSESDERFCSKLAQKYKIPIEIKKIDVKKWAKTHKKNLEEAGRILRYKFLEEIRKKYKAKFILTAHHANDNIETVLLNIIRGTSLRGLKGMQIKLNYILRPLLKQPKKEILNYLKLNNLKFCTDKSNFDKKFSRNRIRNELIPSLEKLNPNFEKNFLKNIRRWQEDYFLISHKAKNWIKNHIKNKTFSNKEFLKQNVFFQKYILSELYLKIYKSTANLTEKQLSEFLLLIKNNKTNRKKHFGGKYCLKIEYNRTTLIKTGQLSQIDAAKQEILPLKLNSIQNINLQGEDYQITTKTQNYKSGNNRFEPISLCLDNIPDKEIFVRRWQKGDKIQPFGMKGTKKLQDIFTDSKIPLSKRKQIPIFIDKDDKILSIGDFMISENHKITPATKKILKIKITKI